MPATNAAASSQSLWVVSPNLYLRRYCLSPEITRSASFNNIPYFSILFTMDVKVNLTGVVSILADSPNSDARLGRRSLVLLSFPGHRSGLMPIYTPPRIFRPAGRVVLVPGAGSAHGSLSLDSRAPAAGPMPILSYRSRCSRCRSRC